MISDFFKLNTGGTRSEETMFDRLASFVIIATAFFLPFFFLPFSAFTLSFSKALLLALGVIVAFLLWLVGRLQEGVIRVPQSSILAALFGILIVFLVGAFFSPAFAASFSGLGYEIGTFVSILFLVLLSFLGAVLFEGRSRLFALYIATLISFAVVFALEAIRLFFGGDSFLFANLDSAAGSVLGKWNDLALFAGMTALLSLITIEYLTLEKKTRILFYVILALSLVVLTIVSFPLAWGILGVFALIVTVYRFSLILFAKKAGRTLAVNTLPFAALAVLLLSVLFFLSGSVLQGILSDFFGINQIEVRPAWTSTIEIAKGTWKESPVLGSGPDLFVSQWLMMKNDGVNTSLFWDTDFRFGVGLLPTFAITTGLLGTFALLSFLGVLLYQGMRAFFAAGDEVTHYFVFSLFALLVYLWSATIFYVPSYPMVALTFLFTGCFVALLAHKKFIKTLSFTYTNDPRVGFASVLVLVVLLIGTVVGGYFVGRRVVAFLYFDNARTAFGTEGDVARAGRSLGTAIELFPADAFYRAVVDLRLAEISALIKREDLAADALRAEFQNLLSSAVASGNAAIAKNPTDYVNWLSLARIYTSLASLNVEGAYEQAKIALGNTRVRNPKSPRLVLEEARLEIAHGNREGGRVLVAEALRMKPNYTDAIFVLAQIDIDAGNVGSAIASLEQAAFLSPNDAGIFFRLGILKYNKKEYAGARGALVRAVAIAPDYANARYFLGLVEYELGDALGALSAFEAVARTNPDNADVEQIVRNLKNGKAPLSSSPADTLDEPPIAE